MFRSNLKVGTEVALALKPHSKQDHDEGDEITGDGSPLEGKNAFGILNLARY